MFKDMLGVKENDADVSYIDELKAHFVPQADVKAAYEFVIKEKGKSLIIEVNNEELNCFYGEIENPNIVAKFSQSVFEEILSGRMTFQRAFMSGEMSAKGDFKTLRMLDQIFVFME